MASIGSAFQGASEKNREVQAKLELLSSTTTQKLNETVGKLTQTTQLFNQSLISLSKTTQSLQKEVASLKQEQERLRALLEKGDKIRIALEKKYQEGKAEETFPSKQPLDCTWKGYYKAGLEKIADDMIAKNQPQKLVEQVCVKVVIQMLKKSHPMMDPVNDEIIKQIGSFTKGWIEQRNKCMNK